MYLGCLRLMAEYVWLLCLAQGVCVASHKAISRAEKRGPAYYVIRPK